MKKAKREYFVNNLERAKGDMRKTWKIINELNSRRENPQILRKLSLRGLVLPPLQTWQKF